jgi:hypothetical protein
MVAMILPAFVAALMPGSSLTREAEAARPPAFAAAVLLAAVAGLAHEEPLVAKRAEQLELRRVVVHPRRADGRKLDAVTNVGDKDILLAVRIRIEGSRCHPGALTLLADRAADLHRDAGSRDFPAGSTSTVNRKWIQAAVYRRW